MVTEEEFLLSTWRCDTILGCTTCISHVLTLSSFLALIQLGAVYQKVPGALVAYVGLFGPGVILIFAIVPFWARLRHVQWFKVVLRGVNATAIGLVGAACVLLWEAAIRTAADAMVFCLAITLAVIFNIQAPFVILAGGILGAILSEEALNLGKEPYCQPE